MKHLAAQHFEQRLHARDAARLAAHHEDQLRGDGAGFSTGHRRIDHRDPPAASPAAISFVNSGSDEEVSSSSPPGWKPCRMPCGPSATSRTSTPGRQHRDRRCPTPRPRPRGVLRASRTHAPACRRAIDPALMSYTGQRIAGSGEVPCHGQAHDAQADESDPRFRPWSSLESILALGPRQKPRRLHADPVHGVARGDVQRLAVRAAERDVRRADLPLRLAAEDRQVELAEQLARPAR